MKYRGKYLTHVVDSLEAKYGSIMAIPDKCLKPIQEDFKHGREATHHRYFDEAECPWNRPLKTHRKKVYQIAKVLRIPGKKVQKERIKQLKINANTAYNVIYQLHLHHRGYSYKCKGHDLVIVSYRQELLDAIKTENLPGPRSETELSKIIRNGGWYCPMGPTGEKIGLIKKLTVLRGIIYFPHPNDPKEQLTVPMERIYK